MLQFQPISCTANIVPKVVLYPTTLISSKMTIINCIQPSLSMKIKYLFLTKHNNNIDLSVMK